MKNEKLIGIQPHGRANWTGKWAKGAPEWTPELIKKIGDYEPKENGEFYMEFPIFLSLFNSIDIRSCNFFF